MRSKELQIILEIECNNLEFSNILIPIVIIIITIKTIIKIEHKQISEDQIDVRIVKIITKETRLITIMIILIKEKTELMKILLMEYVVRIKIVNNKEKYASIK